MFRGIKRFFKKLGPGVVTGAADDDPSGIATYTQTGAQFGYGQLWTTVFILPFLVSIQEACARIGAATGKGIAKVIKENYSKKLLYFTVFLVVFANTINIGADIGAMAEAANLVLPIGFPLLAIMFTVIILVLEIFVSYKNYAKILKWLALSLLAYPLTLILISHPWAEVIKATFVPNFEFSFSFFFIITGVLGTTISPYMFFWEASEEVEEEKEKHMIHKDAIERLREDKFLRTGVLELKTDEGRPLTVTFDRRNGDLLQAWLAKSANSGLGELGEAIPAQIEAAAEDFSYFELGTHTAVFDTPLRVTFSVGGPNHVVFIDVAARDSRTQLHRRGAFKVLGTFEPEFRQRGTARGLSEQRYSDPAHLSFQLTPTALARLQVWLDAQEERGALFGLGPVYPSMQGLQGLGEVNEAARSWANTLLKHGVPPADWLFASMRGAPTKGFEHLPFVYISGYRPVPVGWADKFPPDTVVQVSMEGTRGVIRAASPLDPAVIARLELTPVRAGSIGAFFWATLSNGRALELSKDYGERARLIFKNPRGIWQSSEFVVDVGPTGHTEAPRPEELVWEAFAAGYRDANTGAVDAIMEGAQ